MLIGWLRIYGRKSSLDDNRFQMITNISKVVEPQQKPHVCEKHVVVVAEGDSCLEKDKSKWQMVEWLMVLWLWQKDTLMQSKSENRATAILLTPAAVKQTKKMTSFS